MAQKWEEQPGLVDPKSWYEGFAEGEKKAADRIKRLEAALLPFTQAVACAKLRFGSLDPITPKILEQLQGYPMASHFFEACDALKDD